MAAKKGRTEGIGKPVTEVSPPPPVFAPPQPSRWQLITSGVLVALWIIFLAWMAFTG
jgi:hypothetical protein